MADLKISDLSALSGGDLVAADELAIVDDSASETKKITVSDLLQGIFVSGGSNNPATGVIADNTIRSAAINFSDGSVPGAAIVDGGVTALKIASDAVTAAKIADNVIVKLVSAVPTSASPGDYIGQLVLVTSNDPIADQYKLYVWDNTGWRGIKAPGSVNAFTDTSGKINITTAVSAGTATITASLPNTSSSAQFLAGPPASGGVVDYRQIAIADLPTAITGTKGIVTVDGGGLSLIDGTIAINNSVTASSTKHLVTYDANGLVTGGSVISSSDLPKASSSALGAVIASDGLTVDANGNLSIDSTGFTTGPGTYTKVTVTSKGLVSAGDTLAAADIPDHSAAKLTSGTIGSSLIANDSITAAKLANEATTKFGGAASSDNVTIFPAGDFKGQFFYDETTQDLYIYTGSAFVPITVLSGNLVNAGAYNANTNQMSSVTSAGSAAGFSVGSALPAPAVTNLNHYVVVDTSGTGSGAAPAVALAPPDMLLSQGVGTEYSLIDVSNAIAGQTASNISLIATGNIVATDVQAGIQELDTEKLPKAGGTMTGDLNLGTSTNVVFEGSSADDYETTLTVTNPTADRTITLPNITGTVVTNGDTGSVTSTMIADGTIANADINASAEIAVSKLANGTARQLLQTDSGGTGVEFTSNVDVPGTLDVTSGATFDSTVDVAGLLSADGKLAYPAGTAAAVSLYSGSDTDTGIYSPGSNQFGISTAGESRIVVDASGNVGIGETSPSHKLHVKTGQVMFQETASASNAVLRLKGSNTSKGGAIIAQSSNNGSAPLEFYSGTSQTMQIDSSGRLLVGTSTARANFYNTTASAAFQVEGQGGTGDSRRISVISCDNSATAGGAILLGLQRSGAVGGNTIVQHDDNIGAITFQGNDGAQFVETASIKAQVDGTPGSNDMPGRLVFSTTADGASAPTERMRIDSSGRLLVGASSARTIYSGGIQVESTSNANLNLIRNAGSASQAAAINISRSRGASVGSNTAVQSGDDLGFINFTGADGTDIGTEAAQIRCQVDGTPGSNDMPGRLVFSTTADGASSPTERMRIDSSGRVLLGTTIEGEATADNLTIADSGNCGITLRSGTAAVGTIFFSDATSGADEYRGVIQYDHNGDYFKWITAGAERMRIDSSGNVGIGTTSPSHQLTVHGATTTTGTIEANRFSVRDNYGNVSGLGNGFVSPAANTLAFATASTERMRIDSSGNVLIGRISYGRTGNGHTIRGDDSAVFSRDATGETMMVCRNDSQGDLIQFRRNDTICGEIRNIGGTSVAYQTSSDYRLKENVVDIADGISRVKQLQPKRFNFIADDTKTVDGFIAHEAQTVVPEAVSGTKDEVNADGDAVMQGIDQAKLVPLLTAALQEAIAKIETLETKVAALEAG